MGLFRKGGGGSGRALLGKIVHAIGTATQKVGEIIGSDKIENAGRSMQDFGDKLSGKIGTTESYDDTTATVRQTEQLSQLLATFSKDVEQSADAIQNEVEREIRTFFTELDKMVEENGIAISQRTLRKEQDDALGKTSGSLKKYVAKRVSLDDRECKRILEMEPGVNKTTAMNQFTRRVLAEGRKELCNKLTSITEDLFDSFGDAFTAMLESQETQLKNAEAALENLHDDTPSRERTEASAVAVLNGIALIEQCLSLEGDAL